MPHLCETWSDTSNFFDYVFGRGSIEPDNHLIYDYSFSKWLGLSGEMIDPLHFPIRDFDDLLKDSRGEAIRDTWNWKMKVSQIRQQVRWGLGEEPPSIGPGQQTDYLHDVVGLPQVSQGVERKAFSHGYIYYPSGGDISHAKEKLPVVIYLHEYAYATGISKMGDIISDFVNAGFAVCIYDQIGFGSRLFEEGRLFYDRFPHWSKMGRMVADVRWSVDALTKQAFIDTSKIFVAGYSLGGMVGLYSAALDDRIAGVVSVCGFTPMRLNTPGKTAEGIYTYSHLHGLLPRLGFFVQHEDRIPYDFDEVLAAIAPRPMLVVAPTWDQYADYSDIRQTVDEVKKVFQLYGKEDQVELFAPEDYNRFSAEMKDKVLSWMMDQVN